MESLCLVSAEHRDMNGIIAHSYNRNSVGSYSRLRLICLHRDQVVIAKERNVAICDLHFLLIAGTPALDSFLSTLLPHTVALVLCLLWD